MANYHELLPSHTCSRMLSLYEQKEARAGGVRPFPLPGDKPHYAPNREYALQHLFLDITVQFDNKSVAGLVRTTLTPVNDGLDSITFDSEHTVVNKVWLEGENKALLFRHEDAKLKIELGKPCKSNEELTIVIEYVAYPSCGLYFVAPSEAYPDKKLQVWSQGQDTDNHYWFPCYDAPNQKAVTEMRVTVPENIRRL